MPCSERPVFVRLSVQEILAALRNRRELQRLKPTSKNSAKAGLKPGPYNAG